VSARLPGRCADLPSPGEVCGDGSPRGVTAAICPPAPLLARELTGLDPVIPELRQACAAAAERLVKAGPEVIAVVGLGRRTAVWPADGRLDLAAFGPALGTRGGSVPGGPVPGGPVPGGPVPGGPVPGGPVPGRSVPEGSVPGGAPLPLPLGLGARLLDEAGYSGPRLLQSVHSGEPAAACLRLGAGLSTISDRVGLLLMADGSACRSLRAPGYLDPRAAAFDAVIADAVRSGDLAPLRAMDSDLARELLVAGRPGWQVLAGAIPGRAASTDVLYEADPFGVFYLVAWLACG
jgi:hypothetical protein